ncbi:hypothetical protein VM1G_01274 [Cytospora mali]|uniref:Very-long-chain 3-oxoacyl-CoA reductase n=1 Tax=Cytospora mali TaxID=578113 RepID=A0A194VMR1_CYTMA|nr:hypothetical protein VM1G_01274 [Valsa mali]
MAAGWKPPSTQHEGLLTAIIYLLGIVSCLSLISNTTAFFLLYLKPSKLHRYLHDTAGKPAWALVTGASDGIGKQFCHELAAHGFNVVLHGRNPTKLAAVQGELVRKFPGRGFRSLVADASNIPCNSCRDRDGDEVVSPSKSKHRTTTRITPVDFEGIAASLADINLTVLINNAGGNNYDPVYQFLHDAPETRLVSNANLNAVFPLVLQSKLLPQLVRNGPSLVINIGSLSDNGLPLLASYASSKAFLATLGRIVGYELLLQGRGDDVEVLAVRVGETTATSANSHPVSFFEPDAGTMARAVLARVGCGRDSVVGYLPHALQQVLMGTMPQFVRRKVLLEAIRTSHIKNTKATIAANALAPAPNTFSFLPPTAPLLLPEESPLSPQLCVKPVVAQPAPELVELPDWPPLPDEESPPPTVLPTPPDPPGMVLAVAVELLADEVSAPASMSVPVPRKLARTVALSPLTTVLFRPDRLS